MLFFFRARRIAVWLILPSVVTLVAVWAYFLIRPDPVVDVRGDRRGLTLGKVHLGGPPRPAGMLRQLLLDKVRATPPGQSLHWATYYFLDRELAQALVDASRRGVRVRLVVEGDPRLETANMAVLELLERDGLRGGLTVRREPPFPLNEVSGKLHAKIYAFSWPRPMALVGSYNPSGGTGDDAATIVREIGDQDRGHNMLVEITSPGLVAALVGHVDLLAARGGSIGRFSAENNRVLRDRDTELYFYPRIQTDIVEGALDRLGPGDRLWAAVSHLKGDAVGSLEDAAERGALINLIVHDTQRRVPQWAVDRLLKAGIKIRRYRQRDGYPMHDKFFVIENSDRWVTYFGSLNFNRNSRFLNDEVLVRSTNPALAVSLMRHFAEIDGEVDAQIR